MLTFLDFMRPGLPRVSSKRPSCTCSGNWVGLYCTEKQTAVLGVRPMWTGSSSWSVTAVFQQPVWSPHVWGNHNPVHNHQWGLIFSPWIFKVSKAGRGCFVSYFSFSLSEYLQIWKMLRDMITEGVSAAQASSVNILPHFLVVAGVPLTVHTTPNLLLRLREDVTGS